MYKDRVAMCDQSIAQNPHSSVKLDIRVRESGLLTSSRLAGVSTLRGRAVQAETCCCIRKASYQQAQPRQADTHFESTCIPSEIDRQGIEGQALSDRSEPCSKLSGRPLADRVLRPLCQSRFALAAAIGAGGGLLGSGFDASGPTSVAGALGVLAAIITVHETGHFVAAKSRNVHVEKFSIGFGPPLWKYKGKEVEYSVRAFPLGGFVGFPDDNPDSDYKPDDPNLLRNRPIADRLLVISAGILANCIFAYSILFAQASTVGMASATILPGVRIPKVVAGSAAELAGIRKGDIVVAVGDQKVSNSRENVNRLVQYIKDHPEKRIDLKIARKGGVVNIPVVTELAADGDGKMGVQLATYAKLTRKVAQNPLEAGSKAGAEFVRMCGIVGGGLMQIVTNFSQTKQAVSGPLAIVAAGAEVARNDSASLFQFAAIVNINLALVNALPLPALDGGYIMLLLIEAVRGRKLDKMVEQTFMASGFLLLTGLGLFLVVRDALTLGQSLL